MFRRFDLLLWLLLIAAIAGCAKYNTYYNAKKSFDEAEAVRDEALKNNEDPPPPTGAQMQKYQTAIRKAQKVLDEYPGHGLTDDVLFLQGKAQFRLESHRQSISKLDLLFVNFPQTEYLEEAYYLQALNYMLIGMTDRSQDYLDLLSRSFPDSHYLSQTLVVSGDNSFSLKSWQEAAQTYTRYLEEFPDAADRDRIGIKLARTYWEMDDYNAAADVLQQIGQDATSADLAFRARLLQARVNVRIGDYEVAELLISSLWTDAETYNAQGSVRVVEAENLVAQGKGNEASPLLENLPDEWRNNAVSAQAADILGYLYMERGEWESALEQFKMALRDRNSLDDKERTQRLHDSLQDFISADTALGTASGERVSRLKLLQANALLFGFGRPAEAAQRYMQAAADTAADSTVAARSLYGAVVTYRDHLADPDSAAIFATQLQERYPESPQAFELAEGGDEDLLQYLLTLQTREQAYNLDQLTDEELLALQSATETSTGPTTVARKEIRLGLRRQLVYLSRRANLQYQAPAIAHQRLAQRQAALESADQPAPLPGSLPARDSDEYLEPQPLPDVGATTAADSLRAGDGEDVTGETSTRTDDREAATDPGEETTPAEEEDKEEEEEKPKKQDWDLRAP